MLLELQNIFKTKKQKKERIFIGSFVNNKLLDTYIENNIDIVRFDLEDFSLCYNYRNRREIKFEYFKYLLKNLNLSEKIKMAVDVPFNSLYKENQIESLVTFYTKSRADFLVFDLRDDVINVIVKLIKIGIPVIINYTNDFKDNNLLEKNYKKIYDSLVECANIGVLMVILKSFPDKYIEQIREDINIPVIVNNIKVRADGYFFDFFKIFDLNSYKQNIKDLILGLK